MVVPEWLIATGGVLGSASAVAILAFVWNMFVKSEKVVGGGVKAGQFIRTLFQGYDIPVIGGKAEQSLKKKVLSTAGDYIFGMFCGLTESDPKSPPKSPGKKK